MIGIRVIPVLLYSEIGLVKSIRFNKTKYLGDIINVVKIFNDKQVDELVLLDIDRTKQKLKPNYNLIKDVASECFMPLCYGGGISSLNDIEKIFKCGVEKISINTSSVLNPELVNEASKIYGSQSIVVSIDVKKNIFNNHKIYIENGKKLTKYDVVEFSKKIEELGAGEILLNSIDCDGKMSGYDIELIKKVTESVEIPVIALGGAGNLEDLKDAVFNGGASAVAAGSIFVFHGKHKAVLINYPTYKEQEKLFRINIK